MLARPSRQFFSPVGGLTDGTRGQSPDSRFSGGTSASAAGGDLNCCAYRREGLTMNYKFWVYVNGSPVRLTLKPGQTVHHSTGGPDSEGWGRESVIWKHAGGGVYFESFAEGRDCDGYSSRWSDGFCPSEGLTAGATVDGVVYPRWGDVSTECRDEYAEAAGY